MTSGSELSGRCGPVQPPAGSIISDQSARATSEAGGRSSGRLAMQPRHTSATTRGRPGTSRTGVGAMCRIRAACICPSAEAVGYGERPVSVW
ncbi:MAG: hypothetical protein AUG44_01030 [Actinobacteria bacterium 13_1_20CM_3_71_11]|nr:MAG: hypothetical protein AUG44_01030 [Actinobacteria bacterium 13_1_20CM_3_71_11]